MVVGTVIAVTICEASSIGARGACENDVYRAFVRKAAIWDRDLHRRGLLNLTRDVRSVIGGFRQRKCLVGTATENQGEQSTAAIVIVNRGRSC